MKPNFYGTGLSGLGRNRALLVSVFVVLVLLLGITVYITYSFFWGPAAGIPQEGFYFFPDDRQVFPFDSRGRMGRGMMGRGMMEEGMTMHEGRHYGMLSVNGRTGEVWYHTWHGMFISDVHEQ